MGILDDIRKLDEYLANQNNYDSDSDSVHTDDLGLPPLKVPGSDEPSTSKDSSSDEADAEVNDPYAAIAQETLDNCSDVNLRKALFLNRKKRQILCEQYKILTAHLKKLDKYFMDIEKSKINSVNPRRCGFRMRLDAPYFKDKKYFPSPLNADALAMYTAKKSPQVTPKYLPWRCGEKTELAVTVYTDICEQRLAQIERLIQNSTDTDLLELKNIFGNKSVIEDLATNWEEETLDNIEEKIAKIKSDSNALNPDSESGIRANQSELIDSKPSTSGIKGKKSRFIVDSLPSTSGSKWNYSGFNFDSEPSSSGSKENQSRFNADSEPSTSGSKANQSRFNVDSEPSTSGSKWNHSGFNSDSGPSTSGNKENQSRFNVDSQPSTSGIKVNQSRFNVDSEPSTSGSKWNHSGFNSDSGPSTSGNKENQSRFNVDSQPSTSGIEVNQPRFNVDSEPSTSGSKWNHSGFNSDSGPSTSGNKVKKSRLNLDLEPSTSSETNNKPANNKKLESTLKNANSGLKYKIIENKNTNESPRSFNITIVDTNDEQGGSNASNIEIQSEPNESKCEKSFGIIDLDSDSLGNIDLDSESLGITDLDSENLGITDFDSEILGNTDLDSENLGITDLDSESLGIIDMDSENLGITDLDSESLGITDLDSENLGITDLEAESLGIIDMDSENLGITDLDSESLGIIDLDSDAPKDLTCSYYEPPENKELIALQNKRTILRCISQWSSKNIDWYKISLKGRYEDYECAALWNVYLNPKFTKNLWTIVQDEALKRLAEENNFENWDLIAQHLNINKSAYQCCAHFHAQLRDNLNADNWTPEEDETLKKIVELCRINNHISWSKVEFYFQNRSRTQVYNRYRYVLAPVKKGTFSNAENVLLLTLTNLYGNDLMRISKYFKNRDIQQLRNRLRSMVGEIRDWTLEDDKAIILHVHTHGDKDWKLLSELGQNPACVRHRFNYIKKWMEMNPDGKIEDMKRRNKNHHKVRLQKRSHIIDPVVDQLTLDARKHANNREILNLTYIENELKKQSELILPEKVIKGRKPNKNITLDGLLVDYFKTTYTFPEDINEENHLDETVERIKLIWMYLNVQLEIPNLEVLQNHPKLDEYDVKILSKLRESPIQTNHMWRMTMPPSPETLVGYRGLWLLTPQLRSQAKGEKMKGLYYAYDQPALFKKVRGYHLCNAKIHQYLQSLPKEQKQQIIRERQIFWERFYVLFKWPCLLSHLPNIPEIKPDENTTLGNDTKLDKKRKITEETLDNVNINELSPEKKPDENTSPVNDAKLDKKRKIMEETLDNGNIIELSPEKKPKIN